MFIWRESEHHSTGGGALASLEIRGNVIEVTNLPYLTYKLSEWKAFRRDLAA